MQINPYLHFTGNCREAIALYESALGAKIELIVTYAEGPTSPHPGWEQKIMHATLSIEGQQLMCSDGPPGYAEKPAAFSISINVTDTAKAEALFAALSEGGIIHMPPGKTFFATLFTMFTDRFGTPWMINCT